MNVDELLRLYVAGERSFHKVDFSGADLSGADLSGADLSGANLSKADLRRADLSGANLSKADLRRADLSGANLSKADLRRADLSGANLSKADLSKANFRSASLRGANLNEVVLWKADLSGADLRQTSCYRALLNEAYLSDANLGEANLIETDLRKATLWFANLYKANLTGAFLYNADLSQANLTGAVLCKAYLSKVSLNLTNLSKANLSGANLNQVNLIWGNLEEAILTAACIKDWNINSYTNLNHVICDYVYLKEDQQERRPHTGNFAPGEFTKLFQESLETVDLIFREGVDWEAFAYSFANTQIVNEDTSLTIQSIENKGDGTVVIRVGVPPNANKEKIDGDFWKGYEFAHQTLETHYQARLEDKDNHINQLFNFVNQLQEKLGEVPKLMSEAKKEYHIHGSAVSVGNEGNQAGFAGKVEGDLIGTQNNYPAEKQQTLAEAAKEIQKLLKQLEETNPTATEVEQQGYVSALVPSNLKGKFVSALQAGWKESIKELLDNSYLNVAIATLEGWQSAGK